MKTARFCVFLALLAGLAVGCNNAQPKTSEPPPPEVQVCLPVVKEITDYEVFAGRTEAVKTVDVRARVTGYLEKVNFKEGKDVKEGDVLFEIDPRSYTADFDRAEAAVVKAEAHLRRLDTDLQRAVNLLQRRAMSQEEYDKVAGDRAEAEADVGVSKASRDVSRLNLNYCKVLSPIDGRVSRQNIDPGNLVKADDTILTSIVSLDPIYAYFDVDERTLLKLRRLVQEGKIQSAREVEVPVFLGLSDEEGYSLAGIINFADNKVDPTTGTLRARGIFPNPKTLLSPGLFVRCRVRIGSPYQPILIAEQALGTDQGQKFLYVVNDQDKVEYRKVTVGSLHEGLRVIVDGLHPGERVVFSGLQRVRPNLKVNPKLVELPTQPVNPNPVFLDKPELKKSKGGTTDTKLEGEPERKR